MLHFLKIDMHSKFCYLTFHYTDRIWMKVCIYVAWRVDSTLRKGNKWIDKRNIKPKDGYSYKGR